MEHILRKRIDNYSKDFASQHTSHLYKVNSIHANTVKSFRGDLYSVEQINQELIMSKSDPIRISGFFGNQTFQFSMNDNVYCLELFSDACDINVQTFIFHTSTVKSFLVNVANLPRTVPYDCLKLISKVKIFCNLFLR